ncbi:MAG: hypothetical protein BGO86_07625 [Chryseobacterium sp. 36-9]|nr:MAG: hypothetical protein BGO86_07625 [Chryseobacterium sp. 36-9]
MRLSYAKNPDTGSAEVLDRNDYYPFGMNSIGGFYSVYDVTGTPLNNKYNGKELQETGFYDYGWRQYMPDLGRWFGMDQLSETYSATSPYAYVGNNPAMNFDPDGRVTQDWMINSFWNKSNGNNVSWYNTGIGFESSESIGIDYNGNWTSLNTNYSNGGIGERIVNLPGVTVNGQGSAGSWNSSSNYAYNSAVMMGGFLNAMSNFYTEESRSRYHAAEDACSTCQDIKAMEKFLFIDVPMSFAGGELFSAGWKAAGIGKFLSNAVNNAYARIAPRILVDFSEVATPITKNSVIDGFKVSNHAWRKSGLGRGATEELVSGVINGAKEAGSVVTEVGVGKFEGNIIKVYNHQGVKVAIDETRNLILSIRPETGFKF